MDRKAMLGNVAFGGDWSEAIPLREAVADDMAVLSGAVEGCQDHDPRTERVKVALQSITGRVARGPMLAKAFLKAAGLPEPGTRLQEMRRALGNIEKVLGQEGQTKP